MTVAALDIPSTNPSIALSAGTEAVATGFLLIAIVGSGIMAERLCGGNVGLALLANAIATGGALIALILATGAHMNPVVTLAAAVLGELRWRAVPFYLIGQFGGAIIGVWLAHIMFGLPVWQISEHARSGPGQWVAEMVATFGLLMVIWGCQARHPRQTAIAVAAYITSAYWFTASTSFANPAVTVARSLSHSFAGIRPGDVVAFIAAQILGLGLALIAIRLQAPGRTV
jgi:glycerol uptake facilitator-like aquaporin